MASEIEKWWAGDFGTQYTLRNRVEWPSRRPFWRRILAETKARSILEVGCNAGWNLLALRAEDDSLDLRGIDLNATALDDAKAAGLDVWNMGASAVGMMWPRKYDLVFTAGVLIHVQPQALRTTMSSIAQASRRYVLAIEYEAQEEEALEYRGHTGRLWKRPFGRLYQELGLKLISTEAAPGFDRCTAWLLTK